MISIVMELQAGKVLYRVWQLVIEHILGIYASKYYGLSLT